MQAWETLGIVSTQDIRAIKRAYSVKLKTTRPDDDAAAYQALREAYEAAQQYAQFSVAYEFHQAGHPSANELQAAEVLDIPERSEHEPLPVPQEDAAVLAEVIRPLPGERSEAVNDDAAPVAELKDSLVVDMPPLVDADAVSHGDEADLESPPSLDELLQVCAKVLEVDGGVALWKEWPALQAQLDGLPISESRRASEGFAMFVVEHPDVPVGVLIALTRHFQWGMDYRADQHLGAQLSHALHDRLQRDHVYAALNPERDPNDAWPLGLATLWDRKRRLWMLFLAVCLDHAERQQVSQARPARLRAQGVSPETERAVVRAVTIGSFLQVILFIILFVVLALALDGREHLHTSLRGVFFAVGGVAALMALQFHMYREFPDLDLLWPRLRRRVSAKNWLLDGVVLVPVAVAAFVCFNWDGGYIESPDVWPLVALTYCAIWLVVPTDEHPWRKIFFPTFILLSWGLSGIFPVWSRGLLVSLAFAWVLAAHVILRRYPDTFESWYSVLVTFRGIGKSLRDKPQLIFGLGVLASVWALYLFVCLPAFLFRLSARKGSFYAYAAILAGFVLNGAYDASKGTGRLLVWVLAAAFIIQILQHTLQGLADFCLRKLKI